MVGQDDHRYGRGVSRGGPEQAADRPVEPVEGVDGLVALGADVMGQGVVPGVVDVDRRRAGRTSPR